MPYELLSVYLRLPEFAMVASRLAGLILFQPILSSLSVPLNLRVLFVLALALLLMPWVRLDAAAPDTPLGLALAMGQELLLGILMGLISLGVFLGLQFAGLLIAQESGLAFGQVTNPMLDEEETVLGAFYLQLGAVVYFVVGGHRAVVCACIDAFRAVPLLSGKPDAPAGAGLALDALTAGGALAFRIAIPTLLTLFLVNMAMGFVSRTLPQINIATVGFSLKTLLAYAVMAASLPAAVNALTESLDRLFDWLQMLAVA
jgi:flagellar biosynthetic protein FliR